MTVNDETFALSESPVLHLQPPGVPRRVEYKQAPQRREGPEEEWTHCQKSLIKERSQTKTLNLSNLKHNWLSELQQVMQICLCCLSNTPNVSFGSQIHQKMKSLFMLH